MAGDRRCGAWVSPAVSASIPREPGAAGDGGFVATDDDSFGPSPARAPELRAECAVHARAWRNQLRLDSVQAALLSVSCATSTSGIGAPEIAASYRLRLTGSKALTLAATPRRLLTSITCSWSGTLRGRHFSLPRSKRSARGHPLPGADSPAAIYSTAVPGRLAAAEMLSAEVVSLPHLSRFDRRGVGAHLPDDPRVR